MVEREIKDTFRDKYSEFEQDWINFVNLIQKIVEKWDKKLSEKGGYIFSSSLLVPTQGMLNLTAIKQKTELG